MIIEEQGKRACRGRRKSDRELEAQFELMRIIAEQNHEITFEYDGNIANAKSVLSVLGACIKSGDEINLICEGEDEEEALSAITQYIKDGLGEG